MTDLDLGKQLGPLPLGAWVAVVVGGLGIAYYTRGQTKSSPVIVDNVSGVPGVGEGPGWIAVPPPSTSPGSGVTPISTNNEWATRASAYLVNMGYNAGLVDSMVRKVLTVTKLSASEHAVYIEALKGIGPLPEPLPPSEDPGTVTPVPVTPTPNPAYTGRPKRKAFKKDNFARPMSPTWSIVLGYYYDNIGSGTVRQHWIDVLVDYNVKLNYWPANGSKIVFRPGTKIYLPPAL